jgi:hypothetical protein
MAYKVKLTGRKNQVAVYTVGTKKEAQYLKTWMYEQEKDIKEQYPHAKPKIKVNISKV